MDREYGEDVGPGHKFAVPLGLFDAVDNAFDRLIADEYDEYKLACRLGVGLLPEELEYRLGYERYQAWLAISVVERKIYDDRVSDIYDAIAAQKHPDVGNVVVAAIREMVRMGL